MIAFDAEHKSVHYPEDRRFRIWIRASILAGVGTALVLSIAPAWIQSAVAGLPHIVLPETDNPSSPHGFPLWLRLCHFLNFAFVMLLIRSGLSILMDHPRRYFNDHCTPGSEWLRLTPIKVPRDRLWTAKDDARYLSPLVSTPGYRHTVGIACVWNFNNVHGFILTGAFFISLLFASGQWQRLVLASLHIFPESAAVPIVTRPLEHMPTAKSNGASRGLSLASMRSSKTSFMAST